ncbi:hypothetical protein [Lacunimicrobium album]
MVRVLLTLFIALSFTLITGCEKPANAPSKPSESVPPEPSLGEPQNSTSTAIPEMSSSTGANTPAADRATIYSVESVTGSLKDDTATIIAKGTVTSGGWTNPDIHAVTYIQPPPDGIWDYIFTAQRPTGIVTMALAPIETSPITIESAKSKKGIRVTTNENSFTLRFLQESQSLPKPVDAVTIKSAKAEGNTLVLDVSYTGGDHDNHEFELHWNGISTRSMPPQMNFFLTHKAQGDTAKAIIDKPIHFALPASIAPAVIRIRSTEDGEPTEVKLEAASK